jgi:20S proteasome alpha/beta subunit
MTVCIAAINEKHNLIAFATDRMVTATFPPIEFEHSMPKVTQINDYCIALSAGDALRGKEIFDVIKEIAGKANPPIAQIAEHTKEVYQQKRLQILEALHLRTRGINHKFFIESGARLLPPAIYAQIDYAFATFMLPLEALIAGTDESGPRIYGIRNPGLVDCYNSIGFHAIGTGTMHALISLIETYDPEASEMETMYSVFRAKKVAEVAPGVGEETDLGMVIFKQKLKYFDKNTELFKVFTKLYDDEKKARKDLTTRSKLATLNIGDKGELTEKKTNKEV